MALNVVSSDRLSTNVKTSNLATGLSRKVGSSKNLIINGSFQVAQRGTTSTSTVYQTVDRWMGLWGGTDENCTQAQVALTSSDTGPWAKGFTKAFQITNGNQTGGAGTNDYVELSTSLESQDIANSGWDYTSTSGKVALSFWVKSSIAQNFYGRFKTVDGTAQNYPFETGVLSANTWTKITKIIPGAAALEFANDNTTGLEVYIVPFQGTDRTGSVSLNAWAAYAASTKTPDMTSTWYTTNDSTFAITGVQLEVGDTATEFEHASYGDELLRCLRYCWVQGKDQTYTNFAEGTITSSTGWEGIVHMPVPMRTKPTTTFAGTTRVWDAGSATNTSATGTDSGSGGKDVVRMTATCSGASFNTGRSALFGASNDATASVTHSAEI